MTKTKTISTLNLITIGLILSMGQISSAVKTINCKETVVLNTSRAKINSLKEVRFSAEFAFSGEEDQDFDQQKQFIQKDLTDLRSNFSSFSSLELALIVASKGICSYEADGFHIDLKTKNGSDYFDVLIDLSTGVKARFFIQAYQNKNAEYEGQQENIKIMKSYGEIHDEGRAGSYFRANLAKIGRASIK